MRPALALALFALAASASVARADPLRIYAAGSLSGVVGEEFGGAGDGLGELQRRGAMGQLAAEAGEAGEVGRPVQAGLEQLGDQGAGRVRHPDIGGVRREIDFGLGRLRNRGGKRGA